MATTTATDRRPVLQGMVRPTLFIGLGGSGMEVLLRVRRRILNTGWGPGGSQRVNDLSAFPVAQFLHFDLGIGCVNEQGADRQSDPLAAAARLRHEDRLCDPLDTAKYIASDGDLDRYPLIQAWWPLRPAKLRELGLRSSDATLRAISRLYFFDTYAKLRDRIRSKLLALKSGLTNRDLLDQLGVRPRGEGLRIVVVCSAAGGTGSGSFLDMGFLAKSVASQDVGPTDGHLMLMLPTVHSGAGNQRTEANGYAALMELETCMRGDFRFVEQWDPSDPRKVGARPYDEVYLIDSGNTACYDAGDQTDVYEMVADALFEDLRSSDFAARKQSIAINQSQFKVLPYEPRLPLCYGDMKLTFCKAYSSFGHAALDARQLEQLPTLAACADAPLPQTQIDVDQDPLLSTLEAMTSQTRQHHFSALLTRAMPWVKANLNGDFQVKPSQVRFLVGVGRVEDFGRFKEELLGQIPPGTGLDPMAVQFVDTGVPGRVVCYGELSGIPLTALRVLQTWRKSYRIESARIPVHTHRDVTRFVHPAAPSVDELGTLARDFQTFLLAVALGVLVRNPKKDVSPPGQYCFEVTPGEQVNVGNERAFRMNGLPSYYRSHIVEAVEQQLADLSALRCAALAGLFEHYGTFTYRAKIVVDDRGIEMPRRGFASSMSALLEKQFRDMASRKGASANELDAWASEALRSLAKWTVEVEGSDADPYPWEVQQAEGGPPRLKRVVGPDFLSPGSTVQGSEAESLTSSHSGRGSVSSANTQWSEPPLPPLPPLPSASSEP